MNASAIRNWLAQRFELSRHGDAGNLPAMEGMRGVAVMLVYLVHFASLVAPWAPTGVAAVWLEAAERLGHAGVDLFFVLSGYLIYGTQMGRSQPFVAYMRRRLRRIYPTFLVVFLLYVVLTVAHPTSGKLPAQPAALLLYLLANLLLLPGLLPIVPLIAVAWSLSYEMFYYLALPLLVHLLRLRAWTRRERCLLFIGMAVAIALHTALYTGHVRLIMFIAGILLYEALSGSERLRIFPPVTVVAAALVGALALDLLRTPGSMGYALRTAALFVAFFLLCLRCFGVHGGPLARGLSWTPLRWLGNMSYSYYLVHGLAVKLFFTALALVLPAAAVSAPLLLLLLLLAFAWSLLPSALLFLGVERPLSLAPRQRAVAPAAAAA